MGNRTYRINYRWFVHTLKLAITHVIMSQYTHNISNLPPFMLHITVPFLRSIHRKQPTNHKIQSWIYFRLEVHQIQTLNLWDAAMEMLWELGPLVQGGGYLIYPRYSESG